MTKSVEDAAILMNALAGHDEHDGTTPCKEVPDYVKAIENASMKGVKIGIAKEYSNVAGLDPEVKRITDASIKACEDAGAEIVEVSLPHTEYAMAVYYIIAPAEASANLARFDGVRFGHRSEKAVDVFSLYCKSRAEGFGAEVKRRIIMGTYVLSSGYYDAYYSRAQKVRTLIKRDFDAVFGKVDALLTPCAPTPAFSFGEKQDPLTMYLNDLYTIPSSLAGVCASSVPAGFTAGTNLPVGVQFVCGGFEEAKLLKISKAFEDISPVKAARAI
jgi:aspartyl-tRNA(Asn)/glutamyl-tRNA(Gln) amidotransferase subunit A